MDIATFHDRADSLLEELVEAIEAADEEGEVEVDYIEGVLSIIFPGNEEYVINKHEPTKQIWLSSPISGAAKFPFDKEKNDWVNSSGIILRELINYEFANNFELSIGF